MTRASAARVLSVAILAVGINATVASASGPHGNGKGSAQGGPQCGDVTRPRVDDFEDGDRTPLDGFGQWYLYNDTELDPPIDEATNAALVQQGGAGQSRFSARLSGSDLQGWGEGLGVSLGCTRSLERFDGLRFAARQVDPRRFEVALVTLDTQSVDTGGTCTEGCNAHYAMPIALADERWYECSIRFEDLRQGCWGAPVPLDLDEVTNLQFYFEGPEPFDLSIDDVRFARHLTHSGCVPIEPALECLE